MVNVPLLIYGVSVGKEMAQRQVATVTQQHHDTETSDPQSYDLSES
jgi:hypothetical protein